MDLRRRWKLILFSHNLYCKRKKKASYHISKNGDPCSTNEDIEKAFLDHFEDIYNGNISESPWLIDNLHWSPISFKQVENLCSLFTEEEIHSALTSFTNKKSPGPDSFTMKFYKATWHLIKGDICNIFKEFHDNCIINKAVNVTYIALIAKKDKCSVATDYRPIRLTTSFYKLIVKVITERLKETFPFTVAKNQMAFIKGRQITDVILIANKVIDFWRVQKVKGFVIKLDL